MYKFCFPVINALPVILGIIQFLLLIKTSFSILALNVEPIIDLEINSSLICISFFSFITANLAEVPVPHGDRSSFPGRITTVFKPVRIDLLFFSNGSTN